MGSLLCDGRRSRSISWRARPSAFNRDPRRTPLVCTGRPGSDVRELGWSLTLTPIEGLTFQMQGPRMPHGPQQATGPTPTCAISTAQLNGEIAIVGDVLKKRNEQFLPSESKEIVY